MTKIMIIFVGSPLIQTDMLLTPPPKKQQQHPTPNKQTNKQKQTKTNNNQQLRSPDLVIGTMLKIYH